LKVGDTLPTDLAEITLDDGTKTTFSALLDASEKGIVLFSYTKASTLGCTAQACALRDNYAQFKDAGYLIYGLSGDSHTDNAKFKTKQNLGYPLLSDPTYVFHEALGIKSAKAGTVRSVIVVQK
ncbi:alkyl hydroperoxide reductase/ thiol specific antioxidant/ Mal allergen, partial [Terfezia boudieri ATCC MYA-4762]